LDLAGVEVAEVAEEWGGKIVSGGDLNNFREIHAPLKQFSFTYSYAAGF